MRGARQCASSVFVGDRIAREQQSRALREQTFFQGSGRPAAEVELHTPIFTGSSKCRGALTGHAGRCEHDLRISSMSAGMVCVCVFMCSPAG